MTLVGICDRCAEEKPTHVPHERRRLRHGPNGEHLCARHAREAWDDQLDDDLVPDGGQSRADDGRGGTQTADVPCPEPNCGLELLTREEVRAHLEWDHNRSTAEAEAMLDAE